MKIPMPPDPELHAMLDAVLGQLDSLLEPDGLASIQALSEQDFAARYHITLGGWVRTACQLWAGSRLSAGFQQLGILHPDDMSAIVLRSYHRRITGTDPDLGGLIRYYQGLYP